MEKQDHNINSIPNDKILKLLGNLSDEINEMGMRIISLIQDVSAMTENLSEQTNLLAINAFVESTKAGEQGKGFGVIADEINKLAEQSQRYTESIYKRREEIQSFLKKLEEQLRQGKLILK